MLLSRTSTFVSKPVPVPGGGAVDLSKLDPAALINSVAHETRFVVESAAEFNARWRAALRENFEARGVVDELDTWLATGLSNGRPLKLEVMALKPDVWFSVERISVGRCRSRPAPSTRDSYAQVAWRGAVRRAADQKSHRARVLRPGRGEDCARGQERRRRRRQRMGREGRGRPRVI